MTTTTTTPPSNSPPVATPGSPGDAGGGSSIAPPAIPGATTTLTQSTAWWYNLPPVTQQQVLAQWNAYAASTGGLPSVSDPIHPDGTQLTALIDDPNFKSFALATAPITVSTPGGPPPGLGILGGIPAQPAEGPKPVTSTVDQSAYDAAIKANPQATGYMSTVITAAQQYGVPWQVMYAVINAESGFAIVPEAGGGLGRGIAQIDLGQHPDISPGQANDPSFAINWMGQYLAQAYQQLGDWGLAIMSYNVGMGAAQQIKNGTATSQQIELGKKYLTTVDTKTPLQQLGYDPSMDLTNVSDAIQGAAQKQLYLGLPDQATLSSSAQDLLNQILLVQPKPDQVAALVNLVNNYVGSVNQARQSTQTADAINPYGGGGSSGLTGDVSGSGTPSGLVYPFAKKDPQSQGRRTDEGWDMQASPNSPVLAAAAGTVTYGHDPNGFGDNYPIIILDHPVAGSTGIYYGHIAADVAPGTHVSAGDQIGHTLKSGAGNAAGMPGWLEVGFWGPNGPVGNGSAIKNALLGSTTSAPGSGSSGSSDPYAGFGGDPNSTLSSAQAGVAGGAGSPDQGGTADPLASAPGSPANIDPTTLQYQIGVVSQQHQLDAVRQTDRYKALYKDKPAVMGASAQSDIDYQKQFLNPVTQMTGLATNQTGVDQATALAMISGNPQTGVGYEMGNQSNLALTPFRERIFQAAANVNKIL